MSGLLLCSERLLRQLVAREKIEVTTDVYRLTFDAKSACLFALSLLKHADLTDKTKNFVLFDESTQRVYVAQTGLVGGSLPYHKTVMTVAPGSRDLKDGENEISIRFESP